jgi:hypothetical protein
MVEMVCSRETEEKKKKKKEVDGCLETMASMVLYTVEDT